VAQGGLGAVDVQYLVDGNKRYYLAEENDRNGPVQFTLAEIAVLVTFRFVHAHLDWENRALA
jgi:hypothetical protein